MRHPFQSLQPGQGKWIFSSAFVLFVILTVLFRFLDVPRGIVAFELAGSVTASQSIINAWDKNAQLVAAFGLGIDYLYMIAYSTVIGMACLWAARTLAARNWPLRSFGPPLAWGLWLAALFDATENVALWMQLLNGVAEPYPQIAAFCATLKFLLIILGVLYVLYGALAWLIGRRWLGASRQTT